MKKNNENHYKNRKLRGLKRIVGLFVFALMFFVSSMKTWAAEGLIFHKHTSSCYESQYITCIDEKTMEVFNQEFWCDTCQRNAAARVVVEKYSCKYDTFVREARRSAYCYSCNSVVMYQEGNGVEKHVRIGDVCVCGLAEINVVARVNLTQDKADWTNQDVLLSASVSEPAGVSLAPYTYAFSGGVKQDNTCLVSENGTYMVTLTAKNGQQTTKQITISNIDKEAPIIEKCYVNKSYPEYESADLIITGSDGLSGLADEPYSFDGGKTFVSENTYSIKENGTYSVVIKDKAGNCSSQTVLVSCFATKQENTQSIAGSGGQNQETQTGTSKNSASTTKGSTLSDSLIRKSISKSSEILEKNRNLETENTVSDAQNRELEHQALQEKLAKLGSQIPLEKIPGVHSSLMQYSAEKDSVPTLLGKTAVEGKSAYSKKDTETENLVKNNTLEEENVGENVSFAQVSKGVVAGGVLLCIGMTIFLGVFLVKKM